MSAQSPIAPLPMHPLYRWLAVALTASLPSIPSFSFAETLSGAVTQAIQTNPQVLGAQAQMRAAQENVAVARGALLPSIDFETAGGRRHDRTATRDSANERSAGVFLTQSLYDGGANDAEIAKQKARFGAWSSRVRETAERIALNTVEAYCNYLTARKMLELANDSVASHKAVVDKMHTLVKTDPGRRFELSQALVRLSLAEVVRTARQVRLRESEAQYTRVVGRRPSALADVAPPSLPTSLANALREAVAANPALAVADAEINAAAEGVRGAKAAKLPRVALEVGTRHVKDGSGDGSSGSDNSIMIVARWNLFNGGATVAREKSAAEELNAAKDARDNTLRTVEESLSVAWNALQGHKVSNAQLEDQVKHGEETLSAYHDQFRVGRRSLLDVLNAETELFTAKSNLVSGRYSQVVAAYQVLAAKGVLIETLVGPVTMAN